MEAKLEWEVDVEGTVDMMDVERRGTVCDGWRVEDTKGAWPAFACARPYTRLRRGNRPLNDRACGHSYCCPHTRTSSNHLLRPMLFNRVIPIPITMIFVYQSSVGGGTNICRNCEFVGWQCQPASEGIHLYSTSTFKSNFFDKALS